MFYKKKLLMGQENNRCGCNNLNPNQEVKLESSEKRITSIDNLPIIKNKDENIHDLKSYVTFKKQTNEEENLSQNKENYNNGEINKKGILKSKNYLKQKSVNLNHENNKIIIIQSFYRGYILRKKFQNEKIILEEETMNKLKELYQEYLTPNLKNIEIQLGIKHTEDSYKNLISNVHLNYNSFFTKEIRLFTKLYILKYENIDSFYIGEVNINNDLNGRGILMNKLGCKYEGTFEKNNFTGIGKLIDEDGNYYEGYFKNKKIDGRGVKKTLNGITYIGDFILGKKEGRGKEETSELIYEGEFKNDKKNGKGRLFYKNLKDTYEGAFIDDCITGIGNYEWANGEIYSGNFLNGKMQGRGIYKWPDGGKYEGDYINNIKEGIGKFTWASGKCFEGPFKNGKPNGAGILTSKNKKFRVFFNDGKVDGKIREIDNNNNYDFPDNLNDDFSSKSHQNVESSNLDSVSNTNNNNRNEYSNENNESNNNDDYSGGVFKFEDNFSNKGKKRRSYNENNNIQNENDNVNYKNKRKTKKKNSKV